MGVYRYRDGWQAAVCVRGQRRRANFPTQAEARAWAHSVAAEMQTAHTPVLGGPTKVTLAEMLFEYAHLYTIGKRGAAQELVRINRYLVAGGLARVRLREVDGQRTLVQDPDTGSTLPSAFAALRNERLAHRERTAAKREELARKQPARISRADLREFVTTMQAEGLSGSDIQKEIALLKHAFNQAIDEWSWSGFVNPARRLKLPKPAPARQVHLPSDEEALLLEALDTCDSPFVVPLLEFAIETTARRKSLLTLQWDDVDLDGRTALFRNTKTGDNVAVPLTRYAVELLQQLPRAPGEPRVFPLTAEALQNIWKRVRDKTGLERLQFRDMRHVGATRHGKRLGSPHLLRLMTGHRSTKMLETYINFMHEDVLEKLDATEPQRAVLPTPACADPETLRAERKARRLNTGAGSAPIETSNNQPPAPHMSAAPVRSALVVDLQSLRARRGLSQRLPHAGEDPDAAAH
jgi:integrase